MQQVLQRTYRGDRGARGASIISATLLGFSVVVVVVSVFFCASAVLMDSLFCCASLILMDSVRSCGARIRDLSAQVRAVSTLWGQEEKSSLAPFLGHFGMPYVRARGKRKGVGPYVPRFTRDDRKFHTGGVRDFMSLFSRGKQRGARGGSLSKGFIAKSYTTVCPWILT